MSSYNEHELPSGWVREYDQSHNHPYWVDTQAKPPRAIWCHPYEDEQFLNEHPDIRTRLGKVKGKSTNQPGPSNGGPSRDDVPADSPPPYDPNDAPRRRSFNGRDKSSSDELRPPQMPAGPSRMGSDRGETHKRGFFGKLKDKTVGTKEEREEAKRQEALLMQQRAEERRRLLAERRRQEEEWFRQQQQSERYYQQQPVYAAPFGSPYGRRGYAGGGGYGYGGGGYGYGGGGPFSGPRRGGGAGDLAFPILGGLAGGLLLGDMLGGF